MEDDLLERELFSEVGRRMGADPYSVRDSRDERKNSLSRSRSRSSRRSRSRSPVPAYRQRPPSPLHLGGPRSFPNEDAPAEDGKGESSSRLPPEEEEGEYEAVDLFGEQWPPESPDDEWSLMEDAGLEESEKKSSPYYSKLNELAAQYGKRPPLKLCRDIQRYYEEEIKEYLKEEMQKEWTVWSILRWVESMASADNTKRMHLRIVHSKIMLAKRGSLAKRNIRTGKVVDNPKSDKNIRDWLKTYYSIATANVRK